MTIISLRIRFASVMRAYETFHSFPPDDMDYIDGWSRKRDGDSQVILHLTDESRIQEFIDLCATNADVLEVTRITKEGISRVMSQLVGPALKEEIDKLKQEHKEYLFSGITVGAEAGFDDYSMVPTLSQILSQPPNNDPMRAQMLKMFMLAAKLMEEDKAPHGRVGYCALTNAGYTKINPPADINAALAAVNHQFIEFWDKQFFDAGIPRSRIYTHVAACARQDESNNAPIRIVFNPYARPGWTTYPQSILKNGFQPLYDELAKHGNPEWGGSRSERFRQSKCAREGQLGSVSCLAL